MKLPLGGVAPKSPDGLAPPKFRRLKTLKMTPQEFFVKIRDTFDPYIKRHVIDAGDRNLIERYLNEKRTQLPFQSLPPLIALPMGVQAPRIKSRKPWGVKMVTVQGTVLISLAAHLKSLNTGVTLVTMGQAELDSYAKMHETRTIARLDAALAASKAEARTDQLNPWQTWAWYTFIKRTRDFFDWCETNGIRPPGSNLLNHVETPHFKPSKTKFIVRSWYQDALNVPMWKRQKAVIGLLANGLRGIEVRRLRIQDVSEDCSEVTVVGKGGKIRIAYLNTYAQLALKMYLHHRHRMIRERGFISAPVNTFLFYKERTTQGPLTASDITRIVTAVAKKSGHPKIHPHGFRHFYVTQCVQAGMPDRVIAAQIGHDGERLIALYTHMDRDYIKAQVKHYIK